MEPIRIVSGTGTGPTELAAYDAALAAAGVANYNLVTVSSVVPDSVPIEVSETAPDLGPIGHQLTVVEARAVSAEPGTVSAVLGWSRREPEGPGLFYEASGEAPADDLSERVRRGLTAGFERRQWERSEASLVTETAESDGDRFTAAVALAVYGTAQPIVQ